MVITKEVLSLLTEHQGLSSNLSLEPISGDGSDRKFFRLRVQENSFVLMVSDPETIAKIRENRAFEYFSRLLHSLGVPVPYLYFAHVEKGFFVMEDLGDVTLQRLSTRGGVMVKRAYERVVEALSSFHKKAFDSIDGNFCVDSPFYDPPFVLEKELEYFRRAFLCDFLGLPVSWKDLKDDFFFLSKLAGKDEGGKVIHRDFQSRNIMIRKGRIYFVDYQGIRYGPSEYDVASLAIDPYVNLSEKERISVVKSYARKNRDFSPERFEILKICRNLQILGAFSFLGLKKQKRYFLSYIVPAWDTLRRNSYLKKLSLGRLLFWLSEADKKVVDRIKINCYRRCAFNTRSEGG